MKKNDSTIIKINRETVISQVYSDLLDKISNKSFPAGSRLPSETKLSELYGVSRATIRSSIQKLETLGLVEVKAGQGTTVKEQNFINMMSSVSEIVSSPDMFPHLDEFRIYIENACIDLTIKNATNEEIQELEKLANVLMQYAELKDSDGFIENDYRFHYYLTVTSHNKIFELVYSSIKDIFYKSISLNIEEMLKNDINFLKLSASRHIKLVKKIRKRNLEESQSINGFIIKRFNKDDKLYDE